MDQRIKETIILGVLDIAASVPFFFDFMIEPSVAIVCKNMELPFPDPQGMADITLVLTNALREISEQEK